MLIVRNRLFMLRPAQRMMRIRLRRRCLHIDGAWHDHICYALTTEDVPSGLMPRWRSMVSSRLRAG